MSSAGVGWTGGKMELHSLPAHQPPPQLRSECHGSANNKCYCYYNWWGVGRGMCSVLSALMHYLILSPKSRGRGSLVHLSLPLTRTSSSWKHLWSTTPRHSGFPHQPYHLQLPDEENDSQGIWFRSQKKQQPQFTKMSHIGSIKREISYEHRKKIFPLWIHLRIHMFKF